MAQAFYGLNFEELPTGAQPAISTSTTSKDVEIAITTGQAGMTLNRVLEIIEKLKQRIISEAGTNHVYR